MSDSLVPPRPGGAAEIPTLGITDPSSPADRLAFWGGQRSGPSRYSLASLADRLRGDARVGVVALVVVALVSGLIWYRISASGASTPEPGSTAATASESAGETSETGETGTTSTTKSGELVIHVAGAVARPGIVTLGSGARVIDAIEAAGGPAADADLDRLNLAAPVVDSQRVAVGRPGAPLPAVTNGGGGGAGGNGAGGSGSANPGETGAPLDLNLASQADLENLPGIGPVLAAAILSERERRGGFDAIADLRGVRGIGEQRFADLRELVTV